MAEPILISNDRARDIHEQIIVGKAVHIREKAGQLL